MKTDDPQTGNMSASLIQALTTTEHPEEVLVLFKGPKVAPSDEDTGNLGYGVLVKICNPIGEPLMLSLSRDSESGDFVLAGEWRSSSMVALGIREILNHGLSELIVEFSDKIQSAPDYATASLARTDLLNRIILLVGDYIHDEKKKNALLEAERDKHREVTAEVKADLARSNSALLSHLTSWCRMFNWDQVIVDHCVRTMMNAGFEEIPNGFRAIAQGSGAVIDEISQGDELPELPEAMRNLRFPPPVHGPGVQATALGRDGFNPDQIKKNYDFGPGEPGAGGCGGVASRYPALGYGSNPGPVVRGGNDFSEHATVGPITSFYKEHPRRIPTADEISEEGSAPE